MKKKTSRKKKTRKSKRSRKGGLWARLQKTTTYTVLGSITCLCLVLFLGQHGNLPGPAQDAYERWTGQETAEEPSAKPEPSKVENGDPSTGDPTAKEKPKERPWSVELPRDPFVPLALIQTRTATHMVYLSYGKPKKVRTSGWIGWHLDLGVFRLHVTREKVDLKDPAGRSIRTRTMSNVARLDRFTYDDASNTVLFPREVEGLQLEAEDMAHPDRFRMFYKDEKRQILSVLDDRVAMKVTSVVSMGGAHPIREAHIERVSVLDGAQRPGEFSLSASLSSVVNRKVKKNACLTEHEGTVALRGPGGVPIPVAVLGGVLESCRGDLSLAWTSARAGQTGRPSIVLGKTARFQRDAVYLNDLPLVDGVVDVFPLNGVEAALVARGKRFLAPVHLSRRGNRRRNMLSFLPLARGQRPKNLGKVGAVISAQSIPALGLDHPQLTRLWKAFGIRNPERRR